MVIFHSYISLPEGNMVVLGGQHGMVIVWDSTVDFRRQHDDFGRQNAILDGQMVILGDNMVISEGKMVTS